MINRKYPVSRQNDMVVQCLRNETLIYNLKTNKVFCLNQTSSLVYEFCDGQTSIANIAEKISLRFNKPINEDFVLLAIEELKKNDLMANEKDLLINFNGLSRREVIKKVAISSTIALPIITSVAAPMAVSSQSITGDIGKPCDNNSQCSSNYCTSPDENPPFLCCVFGTDGRPAGERVVTCGSPGSCQEFATDCCSNSLSEAVPAPIFNCPPNTINCVCN